MQAHNSCALAERIRAVKRSPRYSLMLALREGAICAPFDGVTVRNSSIIEWISRDTSKPGMLARNHQSYCPMRMHIVPVLRRLTTGAPFHEVALRHGSIALQTSSTILAR